MSVNHYLDLRLRYVRLGTSYEDLNTRPKKKKNFIVTKYGDRNERIYSRRLKGGTVRSIQHKRCKLSLFSTSSLA